MYRKGFTLIELLVVISIIALLASVVLASLNSAREKGRLAAAKQFFASSEHALADQAIIMWDMNECSGTTVSDRSGNGNSGSLNSGTYSTTDSPFSGNCSVIFNGTNTYISSPSLASKVNLSATQDFSIFTWVKSTDTSGSSQRRIFGFQSTGYIYLNFGNGYAWVEGSDSASASWSSTGSTPFIADGVWHYVGVVIDRTNAKMSLYADGKLANIKAVSSAGSFTPGAFCAGSQSGVGCAGGVGPYSGLMYGLRFYTKSLSASEVGKLYTEGLKARKVTKS